MVVLQAGRRPIYLALREPLEIGRDCDGLVIPDGQVSRRHLALRVEGNEVLALDLGSSNGSFIDGEPIDGPAVLRPGQTLTLGDTAVRVVAQAAGSSGGGRATTISAPRRADAERRRTSIDVVADMAVADPLPEHAGSDTVTILFSDIESHTERVANLGDARWFEVLGQHNQAFRTELLRVGGTEVKAQGDGFMLTFTSVRRALAFAVAVRSRLADQWASEPDIELQVRMGLHTGEAIADASGDLIGRHVIKAARIANLAAGGQILVSETVREIASGDHGLMFAGGVATELKGLDGVHVVHELLDTY